MKFSVPQEVTRITETLQSKGFSAYLVGGCVRDLLLGSKPKDWDVATNATPEEVSAAFPKTFYENAFGTVTVVNEETSDESLRHVEVTPFRLEAAYSDRRHPDQVIWSQNLEDDLKRRDFTINAIALEPAKGQIIDPHNGQQDLKDKVLRTVGSPAERFDEDPLRLLRAIRFAAQLDFTINAETAAVMPETAPLLANISAERIRDEFAKIILSPYPLRAIVIAWRLKILEQFLPEITEGVHVEQTKEHKFDVWEHSLRALQCAADKGYSLEVRLAALFHDIAKPRTKGWNQEKRDNTFYGHEVVGAKMAKKIMERLRFPVKSVELVVKLVRNHMFFTDIERITLSAVRRIIRNVGRDEIWRLMEVRTCDRVGMGRPKEAPYRLRKYQSMIEEALRAPTSVGMLKIDGNEVLRVTGLKPGPKIGLILHALLNETLDNPELNEPELLKKRTLELANLPDKELEKMGEEGKEKKEQVEAEELEKIRSKYHVD